MFENRKHLPVLALAFSIGMTASHAAVVHVAENGSDGNSGTASKPLATMRKALERVLGAKKPSEIVIHRGVYPGDVRVGGREDRTGGPRPHLLIRAAKKRDGSFEEVIFEGARRIEKAEPVAGKRGVFKAPGKFSYYYRTHMWEADTRIRYTLVADAAAVGRYPASFWHTKSEAFFHTSDNQPPEAHDIGMSKGRAGITVWRPNVTVRGLRFRGFLAWRWSCGVELRAPDTAAEDCHVSNSVRGFQIMMEPTGTRIVRCRTDDCAGGVYSQGTRTVVEDCRLYKVRDGFMVSAYPQDDTGIQYYHPASEGEVRRNLCVGFCNGIFVKCKDSQFIVEHNTCIDGITYGIGCTKWHPKSVFRYNIVVGFSIPILGHTTLKPTTVMDYNCLWGAQGEGELKKFLDGPRKTGTGQHTIAADPCFYALVAGDYRLLPDSPCARMGAKGQVCGAFGTVAPGFKDVQPPTVELTAAKPAQRVAGAGAFYFERDPWMGGARHLVRKLPPEQSGDAWLTPHAKVTIEIDARDHVSKPTQMKIRAGRGAWGKPRPLQRRTVVDLPRDARATAVGVQVADAAGNWSEPTWLSFRRATTGPRLVGTPVLCTNTNGAVIAFETDTPCKVRVEFGKDGSYGKVFNQPPNVQRMWIGGPRESRVTNYLALLPPLVSPGAAYHYRLILEDEVGNKTVTDDATFTLRGEPKTHSVSPAGQDTDRAGSRDRPWRTIQFAVDRALPGDRVVLLPGFYPGESTLTHGGLEGAPITIEADEAVTVVLDGRRESTTCLRLENAPHVVIRGLEVRWFGKGGTFYSYNKAGVSVTDSPRVSVLNCRIWNDFWMGWPIGSGISATRSPGLVADRNVIYQMEQGIRLHMSPRARITHNTILRNMYGAVKFLHSAEGSVSRNNSFCFSGNDQYVVAYRDEKELGTFDSDYNNLCTRLRSPDPGDEIVTDDPLLRRCKSKAVISLNRKRYNSLRAWQKATGKDMHSIFKDPKYVDPENWDFRLRPGSPNIGAGEGGATIGALDVAR